MTDWLASDDSDNTADLPSVDNPTGPRPLRAVETDTSAPQAGTDWLADSMYEPAGDPEPDLVDEFEDDSHVAPSRPLLEQVSPRTRLSLIVGGAVVAISVIGSAIAFSTSLLSSDAPPAVAAPEESADTQDTTGDSNAADEQTVEQTPATKLKEVETVYGTCPTSDATEVEPNGESLRNAIARFQKAYFAKDPAGVKASLDDSSSMNETDWKKTLDEMGETGEFCVRMHPGKDSEVDVDLDATVNGERQVYRQTVTGQHTLNGDWKVLDIKTRK